MRFGARQTFPVARSTRAPVLVVLTLAAIVAGGVWVTGPGGPTDAPADTAVDDAEVGLPDVRPPTLPEPADSDAAAIARPVQRWAVDLDSPASEVAIVDDTVLVVMQSTLRGYALATGEPRWELELPDGRAQDLLADDARAYVVLGAGGVVAVDGADGVLAWHAPAPATAAVRAEPGLVVSDGSSVRGLGLDDGRLRWEHHGPATVASGRAAEVVLASGPRSVRGLDAASGRTRWERTLEGEAGRADQSPRTGVVLAGEHLVLLDVNDGQVRGRLEPSVALGERVRGRPRVAGDEGAVLSVGDGLVGLDGGLRVRWRTRTGAYAGLLAHRDPALVSVGGVNLHGVDPVTGADVLRVTPSGWFTALDLQERTLALAVHTPTRGRLLVADLERRERSRPTPAGPRAGSDPVGEGG